jgi:mRNA interferase MazF
MSLAASPDNGLKHDSFVCLDKLMAIPLEQLGERIGAVPDGFMRLIDVQLIKILGIGSQ